MSADGDLPHTDEELAAQGLRRLTDAEYAALAAEPDPHSTAGPRVGGWLSIGLFGLRGVPLTEDEVTALAAGDFSALKVTVIGQVTVV